MGELLTARMPGQVWGVVAADGDGPLFVTSYRGRDLDATVLTAVDLSGRVLWQREFDGHPGRPRVGRDGNVWVAHQGPLLSELDASGRSRRTITLRHEPGESLGAFAVVDEGVCIAWLPAGRGRPIPPGRAPRVALHAGDGECRWSTPAVLDQLSYPGVLEIGTHTEGRIRQKRPWSPQTVRACYWTPLMVAGDRVAATFADPGSGIAVTFFLDHGSGRLIATTLPGPGQHKAILGPGEFLIGFQGYGAFSTAHYDADGAVVREWPTHTMPLVDRHGGIRGPEFENQVPSKSRFVTLDADGTVRPGPPLSGYYTSYPALDEEGTAVFWRDGRLLAVTADLQLRELLVSPEDRRNVMSRTLLLGRGRVALALDDELLLLSGTGLGDLDRGPWPCGDGGLRGNPVLNVG
ncbi:hypothetical protein ABZ897_01970 [Nonomuraea sp. NPDC046802]|uniref:hypothetical protein n=1 Tax=Nonomuraea sp. NPDC046802 TaxID=3154919 RepID=UPI00340262DE